MSSRQVKNRTAEAADLRDKTIPKTHHIEATPTIKKPAHNDRLLHYHQTVHFGSPTSSVKTSFIDDTTRNQRNTSTWDEFAKGWVNSDYESDLAVLSYHLRSGKKRIGNMDNDSDSAGVSRQADISITWSQQTIPDASRPLGDVTGYEK